MIAAGAEKLGERVYCSHLMYTYIGGRKSLKVLFENLFD